MNDFLTSGALQTLKLLFQKKADRNVIIDPFSCLVKLSLLKFLDNGTKISIYENRIHFNSPSYIQGIVRFMYGDNREHLHNLYLPIQKCVEWFWDDKNADMTYMFNNAVVGLKMLKFAYNEYATIQHTIDYYIIIIMQKNSHLISKMGFTTLDIEKITNGMMECEIRHKVNNDKVIDLQPINNIESTIVPIDKKNDKNDRNDKNDPNPSKNKNKNKNSNTNTDIPLNTNIPKNDENTSREISSDINTNNSINPKDIRDSIVLTKFSENEKTKDLHLKDMHKFLFELWNLREMDIVINLYKEMETKQNGYERDNIYSNIMSYCSMKENKLFKYIEENSSIL